MEKKAGHTQGITKNHVLAIASQKLQKRILALALRMQQKIRIPRRSVVQMVALVVDQGGMGQKSDYHWYRQESDDTWTHKLGVNRVSSLDSSHETIEDPQDSSMDYSWLTDPAGNKGPTYTFCQFMCIKGSL